MDIAESDEPILQHCINLLTNPEKNKANYSPEDCDLKYLNVDIECDDGTLLKGWNINCE